MTHFANFLAIAIAASYMNRAYDCRDAQEQILASGSYDSALASRHFGSLDDAEKWEDYYLASHCGL